MTSYTLDHTTVLQSLNCGVRGCGIAFAIPVSLYRDATADHSIGFWCPNGHKVYFLGASEVDKAKARADRLERQVANAQEDARAAHASLVATKGHLTRVKKRADKGVCLHCNRHFANVQRHVEHMHPDTVTQ